MNVVEWLLDSDPAIRWQVMRDLTDAPDEDVAAERGRVVNEGWGARLLALQRQDGHWDGGLPTFTSTAAADWWQSLPPARQGTLFPEWTSTAWRIAIDSRMKLAVNVGALKPWSMVEMRYCSTARACSAVGT